ncbi:retrovirus-related pol polyprotein from transposon tnt 1-94 [Cucumis melo var. makuwa]|uniref:Retrovirus-related pol polyprotein from transposon tnt 1-94 n=1 Tax=Cucumis melo var. makuwa TaxID=1194695 RepID=A0A5A7UJ89_CUCMM|nr:retrovirus-related pol polyprotein from transposon tnt 1-94 [Cucumis melo var. makuwa]
MTKRSFTGKGLRAKTPLELVYSNLCGPMNVKARGGYKYFILFIDDYSRYGHVYLIQNKSDSFEKFKEYKAEVENESGEPHRSGRVIRPPDRYLGLSEARFIIPDNRIEDPLTFKQAMNDIYKRKRDQAGKVQTSKARLVAKGYTQKEGIDYEENFSSVAMIKSIRMLLSFATFYDYEIWQMDVKTVILNGNLEESIYMVQPERYGIHLSKKQCPKTPQEVEDMSNIPYASAIGSLMYAMLYARKSTSGSVFILHRGSIVWRSITQSCIVDSTMEAEYVAACEAAKEVVWLKKFLTDLEVVSNMHMPITLYCDNSSAVTNSREPRSHKCGKHIERKYHFIREIVHRGDVIVTKISSEKNMVDPFTKALMAKVFESHLHSLGLRGL